MLQVTLLKTKHQTAGEARKLVDYIKGADVFSYERTASTNEEALGVEKEWKAILDALYTRTEFRTKILPMFGKNIEDAATKEYIRTVLDCLHRNATPVYVAERFNLLESKRVDELYKKGIWMEAQGCSLIESGKTQEGVQKFYGGLAQEVKSYCLVDENIATNLSGAEAIIRRRYGLDKDPLMLVMQVGAVHQPEDYMGNKNQSIQVNVVPLTDDLDEVSRLKIAMSDAMRKGALVSEVERFILTNYELLRS